MYELEYVKKRKRRKIVAIAGGVSAVVVLALSIVAFLGRFVGTFTVSLDTGNVELTLSEKSDFSYSTSFLRIDDLAPFQEFTYQHFNRYGDDQIDSEDTSYTLGANKNIAQTEVTSYNFFKYTFFVKNVGKVPARYRFALNILDSQASTDGRFLDKSLRVMIYENSETNKHEKKGQSGVFARKLEVPHRDDEGNPDYRAPISISEYDATEEYPFQGYADMFQSSNVITSFSVENFDVDAVKRYTIVTWLEGYSTSNLETAPRGANIKLGVEINAYENE